MIRAIATAIALTLLAAIPARAVDIQQVTSPGGIKAWLVQDDTLPFTALTLMFRGGASMDAPGKRGEVTLMTGLLEEGAGDRDATAFAQAAEELGARLGFNSDDDTVTVTMQALTENRAASADLLRDALTAPRFDADAVERVRGQVQALIRAEATDPNAIAQKALAKAIWGDHPYGSSTNGTAESVATLTRDDLLDAASRTLARDRVVIGAAGDISADDLGAMLDHILGGLPETGSAPLPTPATWQSQGGTEVIGWDSPQTVVAFAQPGLAMDDPDFFPAFVANFILGGGGFSSRLMDEIRDKRGLTYGIGTSLVTQSYGDSWSGGMASANDKVAEGVSLIRQVWGSLAEGVSDEELSDAKTYLTGEYALRFNGNNRISGILAGMQLMGLPVEYINTRNDQINAVTAGDVARVARDYLDPARLQFVLVGRPEGM
ncbi:MAG: pitrilysin family protein [Paracoccus sp. (in: a-proteobacteria)]|uniref:M16 family metallopeptidase n=1 Tax=Paracoccus sp. TaxID=267 RepID=UPI0026E0642D|nr:pitrilysin family protein [Paracoccus sp. (in: a-proteobacteria)]MDO5621697.1 pitrilysin family protein [Paracoccus sp. (in: a-proteobacteria)]